MSLPSLEDLEDYASQNRNSTPSTRSEKPQKDSVPIDTDFADLNDFLSDDYDEYEDNSLDSETVLPPVSEKASITDSNSINVDDEQLDEDGEEDSSSLDYEFSRLFEEDDEEQETPSETGYNNLDFLDEDEDEDQPDDEHINPDYSENVFDGVEEEEEHDEEIISKKPKEKTKEPLKEKFQKFFRDFKEKASAELKGEQPEKKKEIELLKKPEDEDEDNLEDEEETKEDESPEEKKPKSSKKNPLKKVFSPLSNFWKKIVDIVFNILEGILKFLSKIPILGLPFKFLLKFTGPLRKIASFLPIVLILVILFYLRMHSVSSTTAITFPDNGSASFSSFNFNKNTNTFTGIIENTGDVRANVIPTAEIYSSKLTNPITLIRPSKQITCKGKMVSVDIDSKKTITIKCQNTPSGLLMKESGELLWTE